MNASLYVQKVESLLVAVDQDPILQVKIALKPSMQALVSADLLRNPDSEVRVYVVSCLAEIMRITAPEAPYNDDQMKVCVFLTLLLSSISLSHIDITGGL